MPLTVKQQKSNYCREVCHAWCCRNLIMYYDKDEKDIEQFFNLRGITYNKDTHQMIVPIKCKWITNFNNCKLYAWRPNSCRAYECDKLKNLPDVHYA